MAKEIAVSKRIKISEAQRYMIMAVFGAAAFLGVTISLVFHFMNQIEFNTRIVMAQEEALVNYTSVIKNTGACKPPKGRTYSTDELKQCDPNSIEWKEVEGSLREGILHDLASNQALNSVPKEGSSSCNNPNTGKSYTYKELNDIYKNASGSEELTAASQLIKSCSALRVIPDALPAFKNEEALLASLNKVFNVSEWEPESISPSGTTVEAEVGDGLQAMEVNVLVETDSATTMRVLNNIERSIRDFNFKTVTIEWRGDDKISLQGQADSYYIERTVFSETTKTITEDN